MLDTKNTDYNSIPKNTNLIFVQCKKCPLLQVFKIKFSPSDSRMEFTSNYLVVRYQKGPSVKYKMSVKSKTLTRGPSWFQWTTGSYSDQSNLKKLTFCSVINKSTT